MKPKKKTCWVKGCENDIKSSSDMYCEKHHRMINKGYYLELKTPGIKGFDNTPTRF